MNDLPTDQEINYILNESTKYKTITKELKKIVEEPVLFLIRNSGNVEVFEGVKANEYNFEHSDGRERLLVLAKSPLKLKRGKDTIRCHIADENSGTAYPQEPLVDSLAIKNHVDNLLEAKRELELKLEQEKNTKILFWIGGIAIILLIIFLFGKPLLEFLFNNAETTKEVVKQGTTTVIGGN